MSLSGSVTTSNEIVIMQGEEEPSQVKTHPTDPCKCNINCIHLTLILIIYSARKIYFCPRRNSLRHVLFSILRVRAASLKASLVSERYLE
jgi:hypothetical protein